MTYKQQLRTSAWMRRKYDILQRDNFVCSVCLKDNYESPLEVHHIAYYKDGRMCWEYPDYLLVTLCKDHHQEEHDKKNIFKFKIIKEWIIRNLAGYKTNASPNNTQRSTYQNQ